MNLTAGKDGTVLLSRRNPPSAGWVAITEFEDLFESLCGARILCAEHRPIRTFVGRTQGRVFGPFLRLNELKTREQLLFVVAHAPSDLRMIKALPNARKHFSKIAGYVIDSYFSDGFEQSAKFYDHIFSTTEEGSELLHRRYGVSSSVLRQGFDCLRWGSAEADRSIDLIGFGRQPESYHRLFQSAFHTSESKVLYLHSPIGTRTGANVYGERPMVLKLLQHSKISLAFHLLVEPVGERPREAGFVTSRWLESLSAGCLVVGKRPPGRMAEDMFPWPNALIDLPHDPSRAVEFITRLLSESKFISETRTRNVAEMLRRHDWRYRMRDIYQTLRLPLPDGLRLELQALTNLESPLLRDPIQRSVQL